MGCGRVEGERMGGVEEVAWMVVGRGGGEVGRERWGGGGRIGERYGDEGGRANGGGGVETRERSIAAGLVVVKKERRG